jgi:hypothetical protein
MLDAESQRPQLSSRMLKLSCAFLAGAGLAFLTVKSTSLVQSTSMDDSTSFAGMPSLRNTISIQSLPGAGPMKNLALEGIRLSNQCGVRSTEARAEEFKAAVIKAGPQAKNMVVRMEGAVKATAIGDEVKTLLTSGQTAPFGFWDPAGFAAFTSKGRMLFFREAEIKHGRVCMLATLGLLVGEKFHPLLGGNTWDGPATQLFPFVKFGFVPLPSFWPLACLQTFATIAYLEQKYSYPTLDGRAYNFHIGPSGTNEGFIAKGGRIPGDLGFDPLGLKRTSPDDKGFLELQNKELNNGRLAMIAAVGIVMQEVVTGEKVFA